MSHSPPRTPGIALGTPSQDRIAAWAVERLSGLGNGPHFRMLEEAVRTVHENRNKGLSFDNNERIVAFKHLRTVWEETFALPLMRSRNEAQMELRKELGNYTNAARATDLLARCIPLLGRYEEDTPLRAHLDRAISYLEAAAAVEAALVPPTRGQSKIDLHDAHGHLLRVVQAGTRDAWEGIMAASHAASASLRVDASLAPTFPSAGLAAAPGPRPRMLAGARPVPESGTVTPPNPDAVAVPPLQAIWDAYLKREVVDLLRGNHGLSVRAAAVTVEGSEARYDVTLAREAAEVRVSLTFASNQPTPKLALGIGASGAFRPIEREELHRTLHEGRNDPASLRLVSDVVRADPNPGNYAIGATGPRSIRVSPALRKVDGESFTQSLRRIEDLAEEQGIKVEVGVDGVAVRISDMVAAGYEWAGRKGETLMVRKPPITSIHAFG